MNRKPTKKDSKSAAGARKSTSSKRQLSDKELSKATGGTIFRVNVDRDEAVVVKKPRSNCFPLCADEGKGSGPNPPIV
ncbi:MAG TPA: hypothetical protein VGH65_08175 [Verrucomicrobiaceae bacterium]|jgi:hypothetical protein